MRDFLGGGGEWGVILSLNILISMIIQNLIVKYHIKKSNAKNVTYASTWLSALDNDRGMRHL